MGRLTTIGRRAFLIGSVAVGGGVAFGTFLSKQDADNPLLADAGEGEAIFNPWIRIDSDKITLITPHSDKGQGVVSVQAALLAEELDVEFGQFETDFGKPSAAYWNTALGLEGAPFMATDRSIDRRIGENCDGWRSQDFQVCRLRAVLRRFPTVSTSCAVPERSRGKH